MYICVYIYILPNTFNVSYIRTYKYICLCSSPMRVPRFSIFFKTWCGKKNEIFYLPGKCRILSAPLTVQHRYRCNHVVARRTTCSSRLFSVLISALLDRVRPRATKLCHCPTLSRKISFVFF